MAVCVPNQEWQYAFLVTKHSWLKSKYTRIFVIADTYISTLNPQTFEETNKYEYVDEFLGIAASGKTPNEFSINVRKRGTKKVVTETFTCENRVNLLSAALTFRQKFCSEGKKSDTAYTAYKLRWNDTRVEVRLTATSYGLIQSDVLGRTLNTYFYEHIEAICNVSDYPGGLVLFYGGCARMHFFALEARDELLATVAKQAETWLGLDRKAKKKSITLEQFVENRLGSFSNDLAITPLAEFAVSKLSPRHTEPVARLLGISETCVIERDPATYNVVTLRALSDIFCLVRSQQDPQKFMIQYLCGDMRTYLSTDRDSLLASLLDSVRATGNTTCAVQMKPTLRGERFQNFNESPVEETESVLLKFIGLQTPGISCEEAVRMFNCNINYSGLVHAVTADGWFKENKEKLINAALAALLEHGKDTITSDYLAGQFMTIRRLVASKAGFGSFTKAPGFREEIGHKVILGFKTKDPGVSHAAIDVLCTLMQPMHDNYDIGQEKENKSVLLATKPFLERLAKVLAQYARLGSCALVVSGLLDFFTFALCAPYSETTEGHHFDMLLEIIAGLGRSLFCLFQHHSMAIVKGAGLLMKAIIEEGDEAMCKKMQALALNEGSLGRHLQTALFTQSADNRLLTHRQLSRHLVALWMVNNQPAFNLLSRIMPAGLLDYLHSEDEVPEKEIDRLNTKDNLKLAMDSTELRNRANLAAKIEGLMQHWRSRTQRKRVDDVKKPVVLRRRRENVKIEDNWAYFYYQFESDHARSDLIWNYKTREELRESLNNEIRAFNQDRDARTDADISWNHTEFEVRYESLASEIKIGDHYLRLLLEEDPNNSKIKNPQIFFNDLYHRFLLSLNTNMKAMCLQAMTVVYTACHETIGNFNDTEYIVHMLNRCEDRSERDRLLQFMNALLLNERNVKLFIDAGGIRCLVDLVTLAHLHVSRATVPLQSNVLEASASQKDADDEAEWYYCKTAEDMKDRIGPVGFRKLTKLYEAGEINVKDTRFWAQGMDGWRSMKEIPQLKWMLVATGSGILDLSSMATLCLNMLIRICAAYPTRDADGAIVRPIARCKRALCEPNVLPHLVQLFLTFDPVIVERTSILLGDIMEDNVILPRLYLTGAFYFILMYTGSNVLPIAKFLKDTHLLQAYSNDKELRSRSILASMLPSAMVCFLENYAPEKFASIYLGEFDTPEVIWGAEMRRLMIEKLAVHLADFTPRIRSNTRALYQFCPVPRIQYPQLENELFCNIYYLRHLCDETKFPDWPIKNHVELLKDVLEAWNAECDKKPASMSTDDAYVTLGLETGGSYDLSAVRKAYFKMSMKYHPDKNPEGREMFEKVNKAYEFICLKSERSTEGSTVENIVLLIRSQTILYRRYPEVLEPYKYSGYPMLIKTIKAETEDENLFSSSVGILEAACELCAYTIKCSALNAEELRREGGLAVLFAALTRVIAVVSKETSDNDFGAKVCSHILHSYAGAAGFEESRKLLAEMGELYRDISRCLWVQGAATLTASAIDCVCAMAVDSTLQDLLLKAGVSWHLLSYLFNYDFTLDESNVEVNEKTHNQEFFNRHAKLAIRALSRLGGYRQGHPDETPENINLKNALTTLITLFLCEKLQEESPLAVLKFLNSNSETPYLIWDNGTRAELTKYVEDQQESVIRTGEHDETLGATFVYTAHKDELVLAGVFVRIYNQQPTYQLRNPKQFARACLDFIGTQAQYLVSAETIDVNQEVKQLRVRHLRQSLEGLRNVIRATQGAELLCKGHYKLLFSLLTHNEDSDMQLYTLEAISATTGNAECVVDIAEATVLHFLFAAMVTLPKGRLTALEIMHQLVSNPKLVIESLKKGGLVYLLDLFCSSTVPAIRIASAALLGKILSDKLRGPKARIALCKFVPAILTEAMRENPESSVSMFEGTHENPELIWNEDSRNRVETMLREMRDSFYEEQKKNPDAPWRLPEEFEMMHAGSNEIMIGGVFLRLLIKQPNWVLRKPKEFLVAIMDEFARMLAKETVDSSFQERLSVVSECLAVLLSTQNELAAQIPALGHLPRIVAAMNRSDPDIIAACLQVVNHCAANAVCLRSMGTFKSIGPIKHALQKAPTSILMIAAELCANLFEENVTEIVAQALEEDFVNFLLNFLKTGLDMAENPSAARARVVKALKAMTKDLTHGAAVTAILDQCAWWPMYRDQKHDLFLTSSSFAGYLTGPTSSIAGYLTAGSASSTSVAMSSAPPPVDVAGEKDAIKKSRHADLI